MPYKAIIRNVNGEPAIFLGSSTGKDDATIVVARVGDTEKQMTAQEWDALPAWTGSHPLWDGKA